MKSRDNAVACLPKVVDGSASGSCWAFIAIVWAVIYLGDTLAPAVEAFVEATKIGGAFGPTSRRQLR